MTEQETIEIRYFDSKVQLDIAPPFLRPFPDCMWFPWLVEHMEEIMTQDVIEQAWAA